MEPAELLRNIVSVFDRLTVQYFVTGSVAAMSYGEPRFTNDVDIVADLHEAEIDEFCQSFPAPEYYLSIDAVREAVRHRRQFNLVNITGGVKADVILPKNTEFDRSRMSRRKMLPVGATGEALFASPEDVILKKLQYYQDGNSEKHLRDIASILKTCGFPIDWEYIEEWVPNLGVSETWELMLRRLRADEG